MRGGLLRKSTSGTRILTDDSVSQNEKAFSSQRAQKEGHTRTFVVPADSSNTWVVVDADELGSEKTLESLETIPEEDEDDPNFADGTQSMEEGNRLQADQSEDKKSISDCSSSDKGKLNGG